MEMVRNIAEDAKFSSIMMARFVPCCGMALGASPTNKKDKERLRQLKLREEEQDRIIRTINGIKK
jgi:hypothetical protein